jgi:pyruvate,water dikinase
MSAQKLIVPFSKIGKEDIPLVGGKGANLGEMANEGFPVPDGFAVTVVAYDMFLQENNIVTDIYKILKSVDHNDPNQLNEASKKIQGLIKNGRIPKEIADEIIAAYKKLSGHFKKALVAVRSSATAEDLPNASFAGQQATLLNIKGEANLLEATKECWASLFLPRAIFYRVENKFAHATVKLSVIVQKMVQSSVSGVMFTVDPVTNEKDRIVIEAVWGLGEMIVQGEVMPDHYVVQKETFAILSKTISDQSVQLIRGGSKTKKVKVPDKLINIQKISDEEIVKLARLGDKLQKHYYFPQDAEWAKEGKSLYLVQTRPITTLKQKATAKSDDKGTKQEFSLTSILVGSSASPGIGIGPVKIIKTAKEIDKVQKGDVLVSIMTSPDFVPAMKKASAIVTDQGGQTSHAAIVSRELGIPCVVGTKMATSTLKDGQIITVDGSLGQIFLGAKSKSVQEPKKEIEEIKTKTATKLYVNLGEPERAREISRLNVDGVGLLRAEFMIANIGIHPKEAIKQKKQDNFIDELARDLKKFCEAFSPRPVVYRATDFKTNEYRALPGGKYWEPEEPNPLMGFRGAYRYVASPEVFNLELQAIKKVREQHKNLWLMIPFVRSPEELSAVRRIVEAEGLFESVTFKFWMMVEIPVNVIQIEDFIKIGIDGVSIGSNDLTMLISGTDRDNTEVAKAFNERSPAVSWAIKHVIKKCNQAGVSCSICGQAPSTYPEMVEELVKDGITSISVNPDAVNNVRNTIVEAEKKI